MATVKNLIGMRFGRLVVVSRHGSTHAGLAQWNCDCDCGNSKVVVGSFLRGGFTTSCGCYQKELSSNRQKQRVNENHPLWKGGRYISPRGYVTLRSDKIMKETGRTWIFEHTYVMQKHLGRNLLPGENVHHKNGIKSDNRIENLELWNKPQPTGCRIQDQIDWAKEILSRYDPSALVERDGRPN